MLPDFVHRKEDAAVNRLQPVAQVGNCAGNDHAHRVIEIGGLHLGGDVDLGAEVATGVARNNRGFFCVVSVFRGIGHDALRLWSKFNI